jgi:sec-independent protein translocase protein TatA
MVPASSILMAETAHGAAPGVLFGMPGWAEIMVIAFVGLLIFGRRLPEVGRSLGKSIVEFKRGVREAKDQIDIASTIDDRPSGALPPSNRASEGPPSDAARTRPKSETEPSEYR